MGRLLRPYIPLSVRVRVAERQFIEAEPRMVGYAGGRTLKSRLAFLLSWLATRIGCKVTDLRLDHDPALGAREKVFKRGVHVDYIPAANDPDSLRYRPHDPEFEGSHLIKTNHAGDHGQHPDRVLIKKQRRIERGPKPKRGPKMQSRGFDRVSRPFPKRTKR